MTTLEAELRHGRTLLARGHVSRVGTEEHRLILRDHGVVPPPGRYTLIVRRNGRTVAEQVVIRGNPRRRPGRLTG
jgi:hypothetical protein